MIVAVTGATGLVGRQVARAAAAAGHEVRAVVRQPAGRRLHGIPLTQVTAALGDPTSLAAAFGGAEAVVHCAAVYAYGADRAEEVRRVNVDGTRAVVEAAADAGVRRVVVTSSSVTRGSEPAPVARGEDAWLGDEPGPAYFASKAEQEEVALDAGRRRGVEVVLALPTVVLGGPSQRLSPSNAIVLRYLLDPTRSTYPGGCNVVDARDVGAGHVALLERGAPGLRYLLGGENLTWRDLHTHVAELAGLPGPFAEVSPGVALAASGLAEAWARWTGGPALSTREEAMTVGRYYWYTSDLAARVGYAARPARAAVASSLAWLLVGGEVPRWVRESLRLHPDVRSARPLVPAPLGG